MRATPLLVFSLAVGPFAILSLAGCGPEGVVTPGSAGDAEGDFHGVEQEPDGNVLYTGGTTVTGAVGSGCSTSVVLGLSEQIVAEMNCMSPAALERFDEEPGIVFSGSAVLPYLAPNAVDDLRAAAQHVGPLQITSGFRTVAQQYLLRQWYERGRCGISAAALPGNSNHENGRALDLSNWSSVVSTMRNHGWSHPLANDPVHFEHLSSPDLSGMDVHAFQRLWNRNHPEDRIAEDGDYGPQTAARLGRAPVAGFAVGACGE
jgi:hypothetical protein